MYIPEDSESMLGILLLGIQCAGVSSSFDRMIVVKEILWNLLQVLSFLSQMKSWLAGCAFAFWQMLLNCIFLCVRRNRIFRHILEQCPWRVAGVTNFCRVCGLGGDTIGVLICKWTLWMKGHWALLLLSLIHIWRCRRSTLCRSRWSPYH